MTFDGPISTTWGGALADLRDKVGGMASWSIDDTSANGAATPLTSNEWWVWGTATGEDARVGSGLIGQSPDGPELGMERGNTWDAGSSSWSDRFDGDMGNYWDDQGWDGGIAPVQNQNPNISMTDTGQYWLEYVDAAGWGFYFTRNEGDGDDSDVFLGMAELTKLWDYTTATKEESDYVTGITGNQQQLNNYNNTMELKVFMPVQLVGQSGDSVPAQGAPNPDGNLSNFPLLEDNIVASKVYENADNHDAYIGTHTVWFDPQGGTHQDTVQDSNSNNLYKILRDGDTGGVALRMD